MCYQPVKIFSPHLFKPVAFSEKIEVPCGHCEECISEKQRSWRIRAYWQSREVFAKKGFVFFETLTYNPNCIPKTKDGLFCFSSSDVTNFFKRLRRHLERKGYDVKNNLSYLLSCEFGTDEDKTHRPHYHILFFSSVPGLYIKDFKNAILDSWKFGFCDTWLKLFQHYWTRQCSGHLKKIDYTCKYISKSYDFDVEICNKLRTIHGGFDVDNLSEKEKDLIKQYRLEGGPFTRVSKGFGLYLLSTLTNEQILNATSFIDSTSSVSSIVSLGIYYRRKLYYDLVEKVTSDGVVHKVYVLNSTGLAMRKNTFENLCKKLYERYQKIIFNMSAADQASITRWLKNRSFTDVVVYDMCYAGKYKNILSLGPLEAFLSKYIITEEENELQSYDVATKLRSRERSLRTFISDYDNPDWIYFDKILSLIKSYRVFENEEHITFYKNVDKLIYSLKNF